MSQLSTDWLCIATEGDTVDRRELRREWLIDAAETYNPELYAALIWPEHERAEPQAVLRERRIRNRNPRSHLAWHEHAIPAEQVATLSHRGEFEAAQITQCAVGHLPI